MSQQRTIKRKALSERLRSVKNIINNVINAFTGKRFAPAYTAAKSTGQNSLWRPQQLSLDAAILPCSEAVRAKTRDAARNNAFIRGSLGKIVDNIVGASLSLQFLFTDSNGDLNDKLNDLLELRFREWSRCAMMDGGSFSELAKIIIHTIHVDGEVLQHDVIDPRVTRGNPYRCQLFESDYLDNTAGCYGIEYDEYGSPVFFHLFETNPADKINSLSQLQHKYSGKTRKVSADNMRLIRYRTRSSGYRGISELASIINGAHSLDQLQAAELGCIRSSQAFGLIVTSPYASDMAAGMGDNETVSDDLREELAFMPSPGGIGYLNPGEKVETVKSERPNSNFQGFVKLLLRYIGSGLQTSYSEVANDYSEGSYSSLRQERLTVERIYKAKQAHLDAALRPIVQAWLKNELIHVGIPGLNIGQVLANPEYFSKFNICYPGFPWIDPKKAMDALKVELENGLKTRSEATAEIYGSDWQSNIKQLAREKRQMMELGLVTDQPTNATPPTTDNIDIDALAEALAERMRDLKE